MIPFLDPTSALGAQHVNDLLREAYRWRLARKARRRSPRRAAATASVACRTLC
jgi:hypothetical protein